MNIHENIDYSPVLKELKQRVKCTGALPDLNIVVFIRILHPFSFLQFIS